MTNRVKRFISWSGGKDSGASIPICAKMGLDVDGVVMSEVMFDHKRNISGENPRHIEWVYDVAKPTIEKTFGYKVIILHDESDYLQEFNHIITKSDYPERIGKKAGWLIGGMCVANDRLKMRPLREFFKGVGKCEQIVGIAYDEPERLEKKIMRGRRSVLAENKVFEADTYAICRHYGLLSPTYDDKKRNGCWFCPNQSVQEFALLKKHYPELWEELKKLSYDPDIVGQGFKYGVTFAEIERRVDAINNQITIWDILGGANVSR